MSEFRNSEPVRENDKQYTIIGNLELTQKKLKANFALAFLVTKNNFQVVISKDNTHLDAAISVGLPSNNSGSILVKGRLSPQNRSIIFLDTVSDSDSLYANKVEEKVIDRMIPGISHAIRGWLGPDFEDYQTHYKTNLRLGKRDLSGD